MGNDITKPVKVCPNCKNKNKFIVEEGSDNPGFSYTVVCPDCGADYAASFKDGFKMLNPQDSDWSG